MIIKTNAIVLKMAPFSETSRIVTWLSRDCGKIATIIKGSQRRKSWFLGQYDLFYTCELLFYLRTYQGLHIAKECSLLKTRTPLRFRWKSTACASYFADLVSKVAPDHAVQPELYRFLDSALDFLSRGVPACTSVFWFELNLMKIMGLSPQFGDCLKCRRPLKIQRDPDGGAARRFFSCIKGGIYCPGCVPADASDAFDAPLDVLGLLRFWQTSPTCHSARTSICTEAQAGTAEKLLGGLLQYHMGFPLDSRAIAFTMLRMQLPASGAKEPK